MLTGCFRPEVSGAAEQCRSLVLALPPEVPARVVCTSREAAAPRQDVVDGIAVDRVPWRGGVASALALLRALRRAPFDVLHLHGVSRKSALAAAVARARRAAVVLKQTSVGEDDTVALRGRGPLSRFTLRGAHRVVGVSPALAERHAAAGGDPARFQLIPNGVDLGRFHPAGAAEKLAERRTLGVPGAARLLLCVAHLSPEKGQEVLAKAWLALDDGWHLALVGASVGGAHVDPGLAARLRERATAAGAAGRLHLVERTAEPERWYRAADVFALPSRREGLPNALLEAMASGLPCVAARLPGVTDWMLDDGRHGLLVPADDTVRLAAAVAAALARSSELGAAARRQAEQRFAIEGTARAHAALYTALSAGC